MKGDPHDLFSGFIRATLPGNRALNAATAKVRELLRELVEEPHSSSPP